MTTSTILAAKMPEFGRAAQAVSLFHLMTACASIAPLLAEQQRITTILEAASAAIFSRPSANNKEST